MQFFVIVALLVAVLAILFAVQNPLTVTIKFLLWKFQGSFALILLACFALGFVTSVLLSLSGIFKRGKIIRKQSKRIQELEEKIDSGEELRS